MNEAAKASPPPSPDDFVGASSSALPRPPPLTLRGRLGSRTFPSYDESSSVEPPLPRRRSSLLSFEGLDSTRQSASDFIRPGLNLDHDDLISPEDPTHWHSSPLIFALLPALAGLFFTNGSAFVTDISLLILAALFLNWSVRLPWDWYRSAQSQFLLDQPVDGSSIPEESDGHENASDDKIPSTREQEEAAAHLRQHETLALISTFLFPACAAYLLHVIRGQLSRPSEGLISDYNLTIFLLAAEIRPIRQLIRLFTHRTFHLQRIVQGNADPLALKKKDKAVSELAARLAQLEDKLGAQALSPGVPIVQKEEVTALSSDIKKRYEPRLDALERAVRRYEKRATTLTLLTEQRLQSLENRLQDALSLAAVAAQSSGKPGIISAILSTLAKALAVPLEVVWFLFVWPLTVTESLLKKAAALVLGPQPATRRRNASKGPKSRTEKKKDDSYFTPRY